MPIRYLIIALLLMLPLTGSTGYRDIYYGDYDPAVFTDHIDMPLVAVSSDGRSVVVGRVRIARLPGRGNLIFDERTAISADTVEGVLAALEYSEKTVTDYDYFIAYDLHTERISGKSSSAAIAVGMSLLEEDIHESDIIISGSVDPDGTLSSAEGLLQKTIAIENTDYGTLVIPKGSSQVNVYIKEGEKVFVESADIRELSDLEIIEAETIEEVIAKI